MPTHFDFQNDDEYVLEVLDEPTRRAVRRWQSTRLDYRFSFHTQHEAGWPCYVKEPDGPKRNLPKVNLKGDAYTGDMLEGESLRSKHVGKDFKEVIAANLAAFRLLAQHYYEGAEEDEPEEVHRPPIWVISFTCGKGQVQHRGKEQRIKLPEGVRHIGDAFWANFKRYAVAPTCTTHRGDNNCMTGEAIAINDLAANALTKVFDRNGEIQEG